MTAPDTLRPIEILMIEDSPTDVLMAREALDHAKVLNRLHVAEDGVAAMAFLRQQGRYADAPRPGLILLDLNMPRMDGFQVLQEMKADPLLREIPVAILSASNLPDERDRALAAGAVSLIQKPLTIENFTRVVQAHVR